VIPYFVKFTKSKIVLIFLFENGHIGKNNFSVKRDYLIQRSKHSIIDLIEPRNYNKDYRETKTLLGFA